MRRVAEASSGGNDILKSSKVVFQQFAFLYERAVPSEAWEFVKTVPLSAAYQKKDPAWVAGLLNHCERQLFWEPEVDYTFGNMDRSCEQPEAQVFSCASTLL